MRTADVEEAAAQLDDLLDAVIGGEDGMPVARMTAIRDTNIPYPPGSWILTVL